MRVLPGESDRRDSLLIGGGWMRLYFGLSPKSQLNREFLLRRNSLPNETILESYIFQIS